MDKEGLFVTMKRGNSNGLFLSMMKLAIRAYSLELGHDIEQSVCCIAA